MIFSAHKSSCVRSVCICDNTVSLSIINFNGKSTPKWFLRPLQHKVKDVDGCGRKNALIYVVVTK